MTGAPSGPRNCSAVPASLKFCIGNQWKDILLTTSGAASNCSLPCIIRLHGRAGFEAIVPPLLAQMMNIELEAQVVHFALLPAQVLLAALHAGSDAVLLISVMVMAGCHCTSAGGCGSGEGAARATAAGQPAPHCLHLHLPACSRGGLPCAHFQCPTLRARSLQMRARLGVPKHMPGCLRGIVD